MKEAQLFSGAVLSYAEGDGTSTEPLTFTDVLGIVTSIPEMFSKPDTVDTTTIENTTQTNIPALPGGDSLDFGVLLADGTYAIHTILKTAQSDQAKGPSWFKLTFAEPLGLIVTWQGTVANNLTINSGASGDLMQGILAIYPSSDLVEAFTA